MISEVDSMKKKGIISFRVSAWALYPGGISGPSGFLTPCKPELSFPRLSETHTHRRSSLFHTRLILSSRASMPIEMTVLIPIPRRRIAISPSETLALSVPRPPFLLVDDFPMDVSASWDCFPYDRLCLGTFFSPSG